MAATADPAAALDSLVSNVVDEDVARAASTLQEFLRQRYLPEIAELEHRVVEIDADPVTKGLVNFNDKLSQIRQAANQVAPILAQAISDRNEARSRRDNAKAAFEVRLNEVLSGDSDITELTGGQSQKIAAAKHKLRRELSIVHYSDQIYAQMRGYHDAIKLVFDNLATTKSDLMAQLAVIKQQIQLGEVDASRFPLERPGISPPQTGARELEADIARDLGDAGLAQF
jgi:hypothetical protein